MKYEIVNELSKLLNTVKHDILATGKYNEMVVL